MKIETLVKAQVSDLKQRQDSSSGYLMKTQAKQDGLSRTTCGDRQAFLSAFTPDMQYTVSADIDRCFFGTAPTLAEVARVHGDNTPVSWLVAQLTNLSEYCGLKDKATTLQLEECARIIARIFYFLKVTELMYFFLKFKSGAYGRFYSFFDPQLILSALREFNRERAVKCTQHEENAARRKQTASNAKGISYREYLKLKNISSPKKVNDYSETSKIK